MGLPAETGTGMRGGRGRERAGKGASIRRGLFTAFYRLLPPSAALLSLLLAAPLLLAQQLHLLIISGISGGPEYAERFRGWATQLIDAAEHRMNVPAANIAYLSEAPAKDSSGVSVGPSTKESIERVFADLAGKAAPDDVILVVLIGHGSAQ